MKLIRDFVKNTLMVEVAAVTGMLLAGWVLTLVQRDVRCSGQTFFTYRISHLDDSPAWFVFVLLQLAINGFWMFKLGILEGGIYTPSNGPWGSYGVHVPINYLKIFAVNLIVIPASLFAFILIRQANL